MNASSQNPGHDKLGLVVIGRNEGERLARCLASVRFIPSRVYVDSGSTDGSVELARREGVCVEELDIPPAFTAARARNVGLLSLLSAKPDLEFVHTVDGDCEIHPDWVPVALSALRANPGLAAVYGRLRERFPLRSVYNALCDDDWNTPVGEAEIVGGIALFRVSALQQANYYDSSMIAGEEPDLSMRLRKMGWRLWRVDAEMGFHDVDLKRFSQWWTRTRRTGHAYAELAYRHPDARRPDWPHTVRSIAFWGGIMPLALVSSCVLALLNRPSWWPVAAVLFLPWPMRIIQIALRKHQAGMSPMYSLAAGTLLMIGKASQLMGVLEFHYNRLIGRPSRLIEHKTPVDQTGRVPD